VLEFLVHKCIKDADEIERPEVRKRYGFFSSIVGIICNVILFASKLAIDRGLDFDCIRWCE
jgi:hypothetical protein